jgi:hypothetical protein
MKSNNGESQSEYLELWHTIYEDACAKCIADVSDLRDVTTVTSRVKSQGLSFLTITLPQFCKDFESCLRTGFVDPTLFRFFRKNGALPAFLQVMLGSIFNRETGRIYDESERSSERNLDCTVIIDSIRQICLAFKKIELPCNPDRITRALDSYTAVEHANQAFSLPKEDAEAFAAVSSVLWGSCLGDLRLDSLFPKHGPGTTSDSISGNQKYNWRRWHDRLEPFFPLLSTAYSLGAYESREFQEVTIVNQECEDPVRIVTVPKTLDGPRIIAIEPCCMQYTQQAISRALCEAIESSELSRGHVNFRDQSTNQKLAIVGSFTGQFATIDLSDASDRVPRSLALEMFRSNPDLLDAIDACRSSHAKMPDGTIIGPLSKFASMGSALCFPVESMYFYTICVMALLKEHDLPVSRESIKYAKSLGVYVYGDDLVVPTTNAIAVLDYLRKYNCKVNSAKTFYTGRFRESCGTDAYAGRVVTPIYLRKERPKNRRQASELVSWVATANLFYLKGYWKTAQLMFCTCERLLGPLPYVAGNSEALGRVSFLGMRTIERWNPKRHVFEMKAWVPRPVYRSDHVEGYAALTKSLLTLHERFYDRSVLGDKVLQYRANSRPTLASKLSWIPKGKHDCRHLERTAQRDAVALKRRGVPSLS